MRYTIGTEIIDKKNKNSFHGIMAFGLLGFAFVMQENHEFTKDVEIMVFDDIKVAEHYVRMLARAYRRDDVAFNPQMKSRKIRNFYLVKVDSSKFPFKIKEPHKIRQVTTNCFNEKVNKTIGTYAKCYAYANK